MPRKKLGTPRGSKNKVKTETHVLEIPTRNLKNVQRLDAKEIIEFKQQGADESIYVEVKDPMYHTIINKEIAMI